MALFLILSKNNPMKMLFILTLNFGWRIEPDSIIFEICAIHNFSSGCWRWVK